MKTNKKTTITGKKTCPYPCAKRCRRGFTIIEILVIIAIIIILVTAVLVSMINAKNKAQDNSAFTSFKSIASPAYMCLMSGSSNIRLTNPVAGNNVCSIVFGDSQWPEFAKTGWAYDNPNFSWCNPELNNDSVPSSCGSYINGACGGSSVTGYFCFMMKKGSEEKYMWCTINGCRKRGF